MEHRVFTSSGDVARQVRAFIRGLFEDPSPRLLLIASKLADAVAAQHAGEFTVRVSTYPTPSHPRYLAKVLVTFSTYPDPAHSVVEAVVNDLSKDVVFRVLSHLADNWGMGPGTLWATVPIRSAAELATR